MIIHVAENESARSDPRAVSGNTRRREAANRARAATEESRSRESIVHDTLPPFPAGIHKATEGKREWDSPSAMLKPCATVLAFSPAVYRLATDTLVSPSSARPPHTPTLFLCVLTNSQHPRDTAGTIFTRFEYPPAKRKIHLRFVVIDVSPLMLYYINRFFFNVDSFIIIVILILYIISRIYMCAIHILLNLLYLLISCVASLIHIF